MTDTVEPISDKQLKTVARLWTGDCHYPQPTITPVRVLGMIARIRAQDAEIERLREALREQHRWQYTAEGIYMLYLDKGRNPMLMDISQEYAGSSMERNTVDALSPQEGEQNHET